MRTWFIELLIITFLGFLGIYLFQNQYPLSALSHSAYCSLIMFSVFTFFIFSLMHLFEPMLTSSTVAGISMAAILGRIIIVVVSLCRFFNPRAIGLLRRSYFFTLFF